MDFTATIHIPTTLDWNDNLNDETSEDYIAARQMVEDALMQSASLSSASLGFDLMVEVTGFTMVEVMIPDTTTTSTDQSTIEYNTTPGTSTAGTTTPINTSTTIAATTTETPPTTSSSSNGASNQSDCVVNDDYNLPADYDGTVSQTATGLECISWTDPYPTENGYTIEAYPDGGLGDHNYCRSPDNDQVGAWCFTVDPDVVWGYCTCPDTVVPTQPPVDTTGVCNPNSDTWTDSNDNTCAVYGNANACTTDGELGPYWADNGMDPANIDLYSYANDGYSPWNCPECGCTPSATTASPDETTAAPGTTTETPATTFTTTYSTPNTGSSQSDCVVNENYNLPADYDGTISQTVDGIECMAWTDPYPAEYGYTPEAYPDGGLGDHNYCRSPDNDQVGAWCFTVDPNVEWGYCTCPDTVVPTQPPVDTSGVCNPNSDTWTDSSGNTCAVYGNAQACTTDGELGPYWADNGMDPADVDLYSVGNDGYSPWNCPECGCTPAENTGGRRKRRGTVIYKAVAIVQYSGRTEIPDTSELEEILLESTNNAVSTENVIDYGAEIAVPVVATVVVTGTSSGIAFQHFN